MSNTYSFFTVAGHGLLIVCLAFLAYEMARIRKHGGPHPPQWVVGVVAVFYTAPAGLFAAVCWGLFQTLLSEAGGTWSPDRSGQTGAFLAFWLIAWVAWMNGRQAR